MPGNLVKCRDHKWAPWCIVCVHVANRLVKKCIACENDDGRQTDYLCRACADRLPEPSVDDLMCVCIHCARTIVAPLEVIRPENTDSSEQKGDGV